MGLEVVSDTNGYVTCLRLSSASFLFTVTVYKVSVSTLAQVMLQAELEAAVIGRALIAAGVGGEQCGCAHGQTCADCECIGLNLGACDFVLVALVKILTEQNY